MNREKAIKEALKRTPIEGLEWILEDDRFGFGENWSENDLPECEEEWAGYYIEMAIDALKKQRAVVHCGDCENFCFDNISPNAGRCMLTNKSHSKTWFCAHGKREEV